MEMDSMVRPMKWHIYHDEQDGEAFPLCWDGMAIEFNSEVEARKFAEDHPEIGTDWFIKEVTFCKEYHNSYLSTVKRSDC